MSRQRLLTTTIMLCCASVAAAGYGVLHLPGQRPNEGSDEKPTASVVKDRVVLTEEKVKRAGIQTAAAESRKLQPIRTVPGRIEYNATRHIAVKSPADGMVRKMAVIVGNHV